MIEFIDGAGEVFQVDDIEVESLPKGKITRLLVKLVHDALGRPICVPVMVARGEKPGPVFGLTSALHGNELNGIPVIHQLFRNLNLSNLRGCLIAAVVTNIPSFLMEQRFFIDGKDLNHIMPGKPEGTTSDVYAYRLVQRIVKHFDYMIDLHTASFGRINSLYIRADMKNPTTAQMAYLQRPQIIVHNPASDHTLRGTAMEMGIPAITLEIGNPHRFQPEYIKRSLLGVRAVLSEAGMLSKRSMAMGKPPILCASSEWIYTDGGGLLEVFPGVTELVEEGEEIARLTNTFGDVIRNYQSPARGIVIGKSVNPTGQTGARILHLGLIADPSVDIFQERRPWKSRNKEKET